MNKKRRQFSDEFKIELRRGPQHREYNLSSSLIDRWQKLIHGGPINPCLLAVAVCSPVKQYSINKRCQRPDRRRLKKIPGPPKDHKTPSAKHSDIDNEKTPGKLKKNRRTFDKLARPA